MTHVSGVPGLRHRFRWGSRLFLVLYGDGRSRYRAGYLISLSAIRHLFHHLIAEMAPHRRSGKTGCPCPLCVPDPVQYRLPDSGETASAEDSNRPVTPVAISLAGAPAGAAIGRHNP